MKLHLSHRTAGVSEAKRAALAADPETLSNDGAIASRADLETSDLGSPENSKEWAEGELLERRGTLEDTAHGCRSSCEDCIACKAGATDNSLGNFFIH